MIYYFITSFTVNLNLTKANTQRLMSFIIVNGIIDSGQMIIGVTSPHITAKIHIKISMFNESTK